MRRKRRMMLFWLIPVFFTVIVACGGSGTSAKSKEVSGVTTDQENSTGNTQPTPADMEGTWVYSTNSFRGEMVFDSSARLLKFTNSQCGNQTADASVFIAADPDYEVKIRQWNWCEDTSQYLKFAMNFTNEERTRLEGIVDLHLDPTYKRYHIAMGKN